MKAVAVLKALFPTSIVVLGLTVGVVFAQPGAEPANPSTAAPAAEQPGTTQEPANAPAVPSSGPQGAPEAAGAQPPSAAPSGTHTDSSGGAVAPPPGAQEKAEPVAAANWWETIAGQPYVFEGSYWLPPAAATTADGSDRLFLAVLGMSIFFFVAITGAVIYFVIRYRHRPGHKAEPSPAHSDTLEITWTIIPTIICVFLFVYGWRSYMDMTAIPETRPENQIAITGRKWSWNFRYYNGVEDNVLHVPVNQPVKLIITSQDVLHSVFVPVFRIKVDAVPRRYTYLWFYATKPGVYRFYCTEYCGTDHSQMKTKVVVHEAGKYEQYLADSFAKKGSVTGKDLGLIVYEKKGCNACHTLDGSPKIGPSFKGSFGTDVKLADGSTVKMDAAYIRNSIQSPQAQARPGFPPSMPVTGLSDKEIDGVIALIESLK